MKQDNARVWKTSVGSPKRANKSRNLHVRTLTLMTNVRSLGSRPLTFRFLNAFVSALKKTARVSPGCACM
ncbi:hypothetical protein EFP23_10185 [Lacticaseibacillus paracasei]|nr:hypothetical protein [Lacticaseibacillus paracasei]MCT3344916.1 hypothetical protein [Lacticaseibacillus paracasei]QHC81616.1 hypothetical protein F5J09_07330 [Lacticaseibacillus paracasei]